MSDKITNGLEISIKGVVFYKSWDPKTKRLRKTPPKRGFDIIGILFWPKNLNKELYLINLNILFRVSCHIQKITYSNTSC